MKNTKTILVVSALAFSSGSFAADPVVRSVVGGAVGGAGGAAVGQEIGGKRGASAKEDARDYEMNGAALIAHLSFAGNNSITSVVDITSPNAA